MKFCCKDMRLFVTDPRDPINYNDKLREYYIDAPKTSNIITMEYCPWCGKKLPPSLRNRYGDLITKEYNLDPWDDTDKLPIEFKSDEWWKKRQL